MTRYLLMLLVLGCGPTRLDMDGGEPCMCSVPDTYVAEGRDGLYCRGRLGDAGPDELDAGWVDGPRPDAVVVCMDGGAR